MASVAQIIADVARSLGVEPATAEADAYVESGLNPRAVGDNGTSFGLFQLHRGGELGNLTPEQAFDPFTNASVALREFARVQAAHPGIDPGQLAAQAERPANPGPYAARVDQVRQQIISGQLNLDGFTPGVGDVTGGGNPQTVGFSIPGCDAPTAFLRPECIAQGLFQKGADAVGQVGQTGAGIAAAGGAVGASIAGIPSSIGHGIANALALGAEDAGIFLKRQLVALTVAVVVLLILFG